MHKRKTEKMTLNREGFLAELYTPEEDRFPGKVLIVLTGGDGIFLIAKKTAKAFCQRGLHALALCTWNHRGLPDTLTRVPLDTVQKAAVHLHKRGFEKVGLWGISLGAEYALLCGAHLGEISAVIAVSPFFLSTQAQQTVTLRHLTMRLFDAPAYSLHGQDLPYAPLTLSGRRVFRDCVKTRSIATFSLFEGLMADAPEEARIPVERIRGPVLLLSAGEDTMWNAPEACRQMTARLREKDFSHAFLHLHYEEASHALLPFVTCGRFIYRIERQKPEACRKSCEDAFEKTLGFLRTW